MYASGYDEHTGILVGIYWGSEITAADYERCLQSIAAAGNSAAARNQGLICVLVGGRGSPAPPPIWRKRMAAATDALPVESCHLALITSSAVHRGVLTAVAWLTRGRPGFHLAAFLSLDQAAKWAHERTGKPANVIERLYAQAFEKLTVLQ